jgi:membrane fusion protein (multidrug efflux system)
MSETNLSSNSNKRKKLLIGFAGVVAVAAAGSAIYHQLASSIVSTDNAYAAVESSQVTPYVGGTIAQVLATDTQAVKKGDVLVTIDQTDIKLTLAGAQADMQKAKAGVSAAESELERANIELKRRLALIDSGSISADELTSAKNAVSVAKASCDSAKAAVALIQTKIDQANIDMERTVVRAPVDGIVAKRQVQLGQRVQAGTPLLSVVPIQQIHVDANFKEVQLDKVRVGQPVKLHADIYGSSVTYNGVVEGFSGGSGSAFSAIPAQNASGNWIKIVQRLPVRVKLNPNELQAHPLKVGLSMSAEIDTSSVKN